MESEVFILLQQKILGSLEHMQATHMNSEFVLSAKRGKKPTVIIATMRQTRTKSIWYNRTSGQACKYEGNYNSHNSNFHGAIIYLEFNSNYFETNKEVTT